MIAGDVRKNFAAMPWLLKLIALNAVVGVVFVAASAFVPINAFGRTVPVTEWWSCGAGPLVAVATLPLFVSAWLMLRRSPLARTLYLGGLALLSLSVPAVAPLTGADIRLTIPGLLVWLLLLIPVLSCYLYFNRGVRKYFEVERRS